MFRKVLKWMLEFKHFHNSLEVVRACLVLSIWFNLLQIKMSIGYSKSEQHQNLYLCRDTSTEDPLIAYRYFTAYWAHLTACLHQTPDHSSRFSLSFHFGRSSVWLQILLPLKTKCTLTPENLPHLPEKKMLSLLIPLCFFLHLFYVLRAISVDKLFHIAQLQVISCSCSLGRNRCIFMKTQY